jgi:hypothetical protein
MDSGKRPQPFNSREKKENFLRKLSVNTTIKKGYSFLKLTKDSAFLGK